MHTPPATSGHNSPPGRPDALDRALAALHSAIEAAIEAARLRDIGETIKVPLAQAIAGVRQAEAALESANLEVDPGVLPCGIARGTEPDLATLATQAVANDKRGE